MYERGHQYYIVLEADAVVEDEGRDRASDFQSAGAAIPLSGENGSVSPESEDTREEEAPILVKVRKGWTEPTAEQRERHNRTHSTYRPWCEFCARGKCDSNLHYRRPPAGPSEDINPIVSADYMWTHGEEREEERGHHILVTKDTASDWLSATVAPMERERPQAIRRFSRRDRSIWVQETDS